MNSAREEEIILREKLEEKGRKKMLNSLECFVLYLFLVLRTEPRDLRMPNMHITLTYILTLPTYAYTHSCVYEKQSCYHCVVVLEFPPQTRLVPNSRDTPAAASQVLGLKACATTKQLRTNYKGQTTLCFIMYAGAKL